MAYDLEEENSMEEALRFDVELSRFKQRQKEELEAFVRTRIPKTDNENFNGEARPFVMAGGSFAYLLGRRGGVIREYPRSTSQR